MADDARSTGESVISRVARLLTTFSGEHRQFTLSQAAALANIPMTTTHRMLSELVDVGLLSRDDRNRYSVGTRLWEIGESSFVSMMLRETALPHLLTLYEVTGENVHLAIVDGLEALYIDRLAGPRSIPTISRMGGRLPLHTTGVGKVLLAYQNEDFLARYFAQPLNNPTAYSITSETKIRAQLAEIRHKGFGRTSQEMTLGNTSLAVPILGRDGLPLAAVGIVSHTVKADETRLVPLLQKAAAGLASDLAENLSTERKVSIVYPWQN
jgi:DNA-binding IclR family transcriptional regulator